MNKFLFLAPLVLLAGCDRPGDETTSADEWTWSTVKSPQTGRCYEIATRVIALATALTPTAACLKCLANHLLPIIDRASAASAPHRADAARNQAQVLTSRGAFSFYIDITYRYPEVNTWVSI